MQRVGFLASCVFKFYFDRYCETTLNSVFSFTLVPQYIDAKENPKYRGPCGSVVQRVASVFQGVVVHISMQVEKDLKFKIN